MLHHKTQKFVFFINIATTYGESTISNGLTNSANFISSELEKAGIRSDVVKIENNDDVVDIITNYLYENRPTRCFIEALWLSPSKLHGLSKSHPLIHWIIRLHSDVPFLATEKHAFQWISEYIKLKKQSVKIEISCNDDRLVNELNDIFDDKIRYMPNIYNP